MIHVHCLHPDRAPEVGVSEARGLAAGVSDLVWYDIEAPTPADLDALSTRWQFHPLAIEDCRRPQRRSRYERYPNHAFLVLQVLDPSTEDDPLDSHTLAAFIRPRLLVTVRPARSQLLDRLWRQLEGRQGSVNGELLTQLLLHSAIEEFDHVLDTYEVAIDNLAARAGRPDEPNLLDDLVALRRDLLQIRRMMQSYHEVARRMLDSEGGSGEGALGLRDALDHAVAIGEICGVLIAISSGAVEAHTYAASERLNLVMKRLAALSGALVPGTIISGAFGMNFLKIPYSEHPYGFHAVILGIVSISFAFLGAMRWRRWI